MGRVGDEGPDITAKAGEEIDLECVVTGGNPPAKLRWFARDVEIQSGHHQEDLRNAADDRTWVSVSRLTLPVSKADNGAAIRCVADHLTLQEPIAARTTLTIHCKDRFSRTRLAPKRGINDCQLTLFTACLHFRPSDREH